MFTDYWYIIFTDVFFRVTLTWSHINHSGGGHLLAIANKNFVAMVKPKK